MAQGGQRPSPGMGGLGDLLNQMGGMGGMPGMPGGGMPGMGPRGAPAPSQAGMGGLGGAALGALVMMALQMLQKNGGLGGGLGRMQQEGHGREADSWVSSGPNMPISPDVLSQIFGREEIGRMAEQAGRVSLIGHSHVALYFSESDGTGNGAQAADGEELDLSEGRWLLNPGSVGQPRDGDPRASYCILDTERAEATWHRVAYDIAATQARMAAVGMPTFLIRRLEVRV